LAQKAALDSLTPKRKHHRPRSRWCL